MGWFLGKRGKQTSDKALRSGFLNLGCSNQGVLEKVTYVAVNGKRNMMYCTCLFFISMVTLGGAGLLRHDQKGS